MISIISLAAAAPVGSAWAASTGFASPHPMPHRSRRLSIHHLALLAILALLQGGCPDQREVQQTPAAVPARPVAREQKRPPASRPSPRAMEKPPTTTSRPALAARIRIPFDDVSAGKRLRRCRGKPGAKQRASMIALSASGCTLKRAEKTLDCSRDSPAAQSGRALLVRWLHLRAIRTPRFTIRVGARFDLVEIPRMPCGGVGGRRIERRYLVWGDGERPLVACRTWRPGRCPP